MLQKDFDMHNEIERARKAAGISGMTRNYPDNPKQRGCGYWAAFIGSIGNSLAAMDAAEKRMVREHGDQIVMLSKRITELEAELDAARKGRMELGIEAICHQEGWTVDRRNETVKKLAG